MSPEQPAHTTEQQNEKPYVRKAQEVIAEATVNAPQTEARYEVIDAYITEVLEAADRGEITGTHGTYTKEQMQSQIQDFLALNGKLEAERDGENPYSRIPGINGLRASFRSLMENDATSRDFELALKLHASENTIESLDGRSGELITTEVVRKVGAAELRAVGITKPGTEVASAETELQEAETPKMTKQEYLNTLADGMSPEDIELLESYAVSKAAQNRAQSNGEYDNVAHWKREVHEDYKRLSKEARAIADQYAHARNYY
ncbi:MAG: hypothetical protein ACREGE_04175 [Candidatus Microsaccharimonas sp.]